MSVRVIRLDSSTSTGGAVAFWKHVDDQLDAMMTDDRALRVAEFRAAGCTQRRIAEVVEAEWPEFARGVFPRGGHQGVGEAVEAAAARWLRPVS